MAIFKNNDKLFAVNGDPSLLINVTNGVRLGMQDEQKGKLGFVLRLSVNLICRNAPAALGDFS
jgi:hypothetical protein